MLLNISFRYHPSPDSQSNQPVFDFTDQAIISNILYLHIVPTLTDVYIRLDSLNSRNKIRTKYYITLYYNIVLAGTIWAKFDLY